jgi:hypothetical protein
MCRGEDAYLAAIPAGARRPVIMRGSPRPTLSMRSPRKRCDDLADNAEEVCEKEAKVARARFGQP